MAQTFDIWAATKGYTDSLIHYVKGDCRDATTTAACGAETTGSATFRFDRDAYCPECRAAFEGAR